MWYKVEFTDIFGSKEHLEQIVKSLGGECKILTEKPQACGPDCPDTYALITVPPHEVRNLAYGDLFIDNFIPILEVSGWSTYCKRYGIKL